MNEKTFQSKFGRWIKEHKDAIEIMPAVYELKLEKGKSFAFDKVKDHQIKALHDAKYGGLYHKINDLPVYSGSATRFASRKPFDCFFVRGMKAFVVIGFYTKQKKIESCFMDIDNFISLKKFYLERGRKSLKKEEFMNYSNKFFRI